MYKNYPVFGFESEELFYQDKRMPEKSAYYQRNGKKILGYFPGVGIYLGVCRIITSLIPSSLSSDWLISPASEDKKSRILNILRGILEITPIGFFLFPFDFLLNRFATLSKMRRLEVL